MKSLKLKRWSSPLTSPHPGTDKAFWSFKKVHSIYLLGNRSPANWEGWGWSQAIWSVNNLSNRTVKYLWLLPLASGIQRDPVTSMQLIHVWQTSVRHQILEILLRRWGHRAIGGDARLRWVLQERRDFSGMQAVAEVVLSPAGINYWLSVSRIFQMGWFL